MRMEAKYVRRRAIAKAGAEMIAISVLMMLYAPLVLYIVAKYW